MGAFKAYDIRGIYGQEITDEMAYRIGFYLPGLLNANEILVGRDLRLSSDALFSSLIDGITDAGKDVLDAGLCTTPMVYYAAGKHGLYASVQITASHNPSEYNGMKVSGLNALPIGYDSGLNALENMISHPPSPSNIKGKVVPLHIKEDYLRFLDSYRDDGAVFNDVVIDASNGMAGMLVRQVFGNQPIYLNEMPDGRFPSHEPNPLDPQSREQLVGAVKIHGADLGMIFDGDGDRVMFVDEKGEFISPDLLIALLGHHFLQGKPPQTVLQDIRTSRSVAEYLKQWNAEIVTWRVGRAFASPMLRQVKGIYGGELAGHYYFQDFYYSDSGLLAAIILGQVFQQYKKQGVTASALIGRIQTYYNTGEINFQVNDKKAMMQELVQVLPLAERPTRIMDFDGFRLDFQDWWFNVRPSNTEPYLRFIAEARTKEQLEEIQKRAADIAVKYM